MRKRRLESPWPFPVSVVPGRRGLVENLPPHPPKPTRLYRVRSADQWQQGDLLGPVPKP